MKKALWERGMALLLSVILVWSMLPVKFVTAADNPKQTDYPIEEKLDGGTITQDGSNYIITPDNAYYISSVKLGKDEIDFKSNNLNGTSYTYAYEAEGSEGTNRLNVKFEKLDFLTATKKEISDYNKDLTVKNENGQKKVFIISETTLSGTPQISDGTGAFANNITISKDEAGMINRIYQLNENPQSFADVVLAYEVNTEFIWDDTAPEISLEHVEDKTLWVNEAGSHAVSISGKVTDANFESLRLAEGTAITTDNNGRFSLETMDVSAGDKTVELTATDKAGNITNKSINVKCDRNAPKVEFAKTVRENEENVLKNLFEKIGMIVSNQERCTVTVKVSDDESGIDQSKTVVKVGSQTLTQPKNDDISVDGNAVIYTYKNVKIPKTKATITVEVQDNVGNKGQGSGSHSIMLDNTSPILAITQGDNRESADSVHYVGPKDKLGANENYYYRCTDKSSANAISIDVRATDDFGLKSYKISGDGFTEDDFLTSEISSEEEFVKSTGEQAKILISNLERDTYEVVFEAEDLAGNSTTSTISLINDTTAPTVSLKDMDSVVDIEGEDCYYTCKNNISATVTVTDNGVGLKQVELLDGTKSLQKKNVTGTSADVAFRGIAIHNTHQLKVKTTDQLGNTEVTNLLPNHDGRIVYDAAAPTVSFVTNESAHDVNGNPLFGDATTVKVLMRDVASGIASATYTIEKPAYDNSATVSNRLLYAVSDRVTIVQGVTKMAKPKKSLDENIRVDGNSNDIQLKVNVTDGAGNVITVQNIKKVSIDKTAPTVSVSYDNNDVDSGNRYKADRTATITVTERNFNANDFKLNITNTAGGVPTLSEWTTVEDTSNPDNNRHMATVTFTEDGDYTIDMSYVDMAGNAANPVETQSFTIDKSAPVVSVAFDNNNAANDMYYAAERTATITVTEHYFDASRVVVTGTATNDGSAIAFPGVSGWTSNGDVHTATIGFTADGDYAFSVRATDQSGNASPDFDVSSFVIDRTAPTITFGGVEDQSAYNDTVEPTVTFEDVNYDSDNVNITLVGVKQGQVNFENGAGDSNHGQTFSFLDFAHEEDVDDIYTMTATITDKAGNQFEDSIVFSVNRFGSNYEFDDSLKKITGKYIKTPVDVIFTETNVNALTDGTSSIVVSTNGTPKTLENGKDYSVVSSGGGGSWSQYRYTIDKDVFKADGMYIVSVYSEDAANNVNENDAEGKDAEITFGVDTTNPAIVLSNVESDGYYNATSYEAKVNVTDNLILDEVKIQLNGKEVKAQKEDDTYTFQIPESSEHQVVTVTARDAAGNEVVEEAKDILISTNVFVRAFNNKALVIGTGVVVLAVGGFGGYVVFHGGIGALHFRPRMKFKGKK